MASVPAAVERRVIYLVSPRWGGPYKQLKLIAKSLRDQGYDAHHCYSLKDWAKLHFNRRNYVISVIPFFFMLNRRGLILNIRGNYRQEKRFTNPLSLLYDYNLRWARKVVLPSFYLQRELQLAQAIIIPNCTSIRPMSAKTNETMRPLQLATITNFDFRPKAQGICGLINIVNQLSVNRSLELHIFGGGRWLEYTRQQHETHNYKQFPVYFHGHFESAEDILPANDLFLYWSEFDNMPNVLLEAAACGLPVVANRYGAYEEILGPQALLADDEHSFSIYLKELIEDPEKRQIVAKNQMEHIKKLQVSKVIGQWQRVIEQLNLHR